MCIDKIVIVRGTQTYLCHYIKSGGRNLTPFDVDAVKTKVGDIEHVFPNGELLYDYDLECWLYPLTQQQSLDMRGYIYIASKVRVGNSIIPSKNVKVVVEDTIQDEEW